MQPSSHASDHCASIVPNIPQSRPAPSESLSHPRDPTSSQVPRLPVDPYAFSRIGHVRNTAPSNDYQQHTEQSTRFGVPATSALAAQPQILANPPAGNNVPPNQSVSQSPSQPSALLAGSSYDPAFNEAYIQFFNADGEEIPELQQEGTAGRSSEGQLQEGPTKHTPWGTSVPMAPPSQPPSLRRPSCSVAASSTSRSRPSSLASSMVAPWLASKAGVASPTTSPIHATPVLSLPTQKFDPTSSSSTSGALLNPSSVLPSAPCPIPSVPDVERPHGTLAQSYAPPGHRPLLQPAEMAWQPYPPYWQQPSQAIRAFPGFRPTWVSSHVPAIPVPGYSEHPGYQTPSYPAGDNRSGYHQQRSDASPVFHFSVDDTSQPPPPTTQMDPSAQGAVPSGNQDQAQPIANADLPYQGMPPPPPPVDAALSYSSFGSLPQTGLLTSRGGSDLTGSQAPHPWPQPAAPVSRPCSRSSQSLQEAAAALPIPAMSQAGPPQVLHSSARADVMPEPATNSAAHNISVPPQAEKRKASASPPSEATQVKPQTKRPVKRTKKGKGKATEPSAGPGETAEVPTLPGESPTAAHAKRLRDARRARRFRELYEEIVPELSSPRMDRNPSDDDVLRLAKIAVQGLKETKDELKQAEQISRSELQMMAGELQRSRAQWKMSVEEKQKIQVQARQASDQINQLTREKQELHYELQSMKAELQRTHGHCP